MTVLACFRRRRRGMEGSDATDPSAGEPVAGRSDQLAATAEALHRFHLAQGNLEHWRDHVEARLEGAIQATLGHMPSVPDRGVDLELRSPRDDVIRDQAPAAAAPMPPGPHDDVVVELRRGIAGLAGRTRDAGMHAAIATLRALAAEAPTPSGTAAAAGPAASLARVEAVTRVIEDAVSRIGLLLGDLNRLPASMPERAAASDDRVVDPPIVDRLQSLMADLTVARERLGLADGGVP